jgi:hypothetical protein
LNIPSVLADILAGFQIWTVETDLALKNDPNRISLPSLSRLLNYSVGVRRHVSRSKDVMRGDCVLAWMFSSAVLVDPIMLSL